MSKHIFFRLPLKGNVIKLIFIRLNNISYRSDNTMRWNTTYMYVSQPCNTTYRNARNDQIEDLTRFSFYRNLYVQPNSGVPIGVVGSTHPGRHFQKGRHSPKGSGKKVKNCNIDGKWRKKQNSRSTIKRKVVESFGSRKKRAAHRAKKVTLIWVNRPK